LLGIDTESIDFEFKWSDNMQTGSEVMDFMLNGDVAQGGRFNFLYQVESVTDIDP